MPHINNAPESAPKVCCSTCPFVSYVSWKRVFFHFAAGVFSRVTLSKWGKDTFTPIGALITMALDVKGYFKAEDQGSWVNVAAQGWQNRLLGRILNIIISILCISKDFCSCIAVMKRGGIDVCELVWLVCTWCWAWASNDWCLQGSIPFKIHTNTAKEIWAICALFPIATKTVRSGRISESISEKADKRYLEAGNIVSSTRPVSAWLWWTSISIL